MRPPEVFVRELAPAEGQRLKRLSRQATRSWMPSTSCPRRCRPFQSDGFGVIDFPDVQAAANAAGVM